MTKLAGTAELTPLAGLFASMTPAEAQLRQRLTDLSRSHRDTLAREIAATIAHEINTPLAAILVNSETLETLLQSPAPDLTELRAIAADIRRDTQRAADVIRHLRNLLTKSSRELKVVDLAEPVRDAVQFYSALAVARDVHVRCSIATVPLPVKGNVVLLHQVVMSVVANAIDAMSNLPVDQRKLEIAAMRVEDSAEVVISDTGPGIPRDQLKKIFEPFFSTKEHGLGLALSIARTIVEAHDGRIWAENGPSGGAVFRVRLPLSPG